MPLDLFLRARPFQLLVPEPQLLQERRVAALLLRQLFLVALDLRRLRRELGMHLAQLLLEHPPVCAFRQNFGDEVCDLRILSMHPFLHPFLLRLEL